MREPTPRENHTAMHLGTHLHQRGLTADQVDAMGDDELASHARAAGLGRTPSPTVKMAAVEYMKRRAAPPPADPFAGL